jgi:hypothetical protein
MPETVLVSAGNGPGEVICQCVPERASVTGCAPFCFTVSELTVAGSILRIAGLVLAVVVLAGGVLRCSDQ